jgi:hemolysin activation/secretion protein
VTTVGGVALTYPLIRNRQETLNIGAYFDLLESRIDTGASPPQMASRDNLRILRLGADYARQDALLGSGMPAVNAASIRFSQGLTILGATQNGDVKAGRLNERVDFNKISAEISRTQTLLQFGDSSSIALQATLAGQYSSDILPSAEKFFLGGSRWNRGYYSGEVTGDSAIATALELQYNTNFAFDLFSRSLDIDTQLYTFIDWGQSLENQKTDANRRLQSVGAGVRLVVSRNTELNLEGVSRMVRRPQGASSATASSLKSQAVYWRVLTRF